MLVTCRGVQCLYGPYSSYGPKSCQRSVKKGLRSVSCIPLATLEYFPLCWLLVEGSKDFTVRTFRTDRKVINGPLRSVYGP